MSNDPLPIVNPVPLPVDKELVLKVIPMPADTNGNGDIFGGWAYFPQVARRICA